MVRIAAWIVAAHGGFGFGIPIDTRCAWLNDLDSGTNTWLLSPLLSNGIGRVTLSVRRRRFTSEVMYLQPADRHVMPPEAANVVAFAPPGGRGITRKIRVAL